MARRRGHRRAIAATTAIAVLIGVLAMFGAPPAHAAEPPPRAQVSNAVHDRIARDGSADVIVALRTSIPIGGGSGAEEQADRREALGRAARAFVRDLPQQIERPSGPVRSTRFVNLRVDATGLDALQADNAVEAVIPNEQRTLSLAMSTAAVGAPIAWTAGFDGAGSAVAIIDSGVQSNHPFLNGRVVGEACFSGGSNLSGVSSLCPGGVDWDEGPGTGQPCPLNGCEHGTHVAGIAAGRGDLLGVPSGVAPGANIVSVMVASRLVRSPDCLGAGCLTLFDFDVLSAIDWVGFNQDTYDIVAANMSFGGGSFSGPCDSVENDLLGSYTVLLTGLRTAGIAPIVASGNAEQPHAIAAPACISSAISVGAVTTNDTTVPFWSNSSNSLDLLAPGTDSVFGPGILSSIPGSNWGRIPGTSMAAPHVTGAIAVLQDAYGGDLTVDEAEELLKSTGRPVVDGRQGRVTPLIQLDEAIPRPKGTYHAVTPSRLLDTRDGVGAPRRRLGPGQSIDLQVGGRGGVPATGVSAVVLNVTYVSPSSFGFITVFPTGALRPTASNLNLNPGDARPNLVTVRIGANGKVSLYNEAGTVDLVADIAGWYDTETTNNGSSYHPASPTRVLDTRAGTGAPQAKVGPGQELTIDVTGIDPALSPVPAGADAVVVNVVGTGATAGTHVTAYPAGVGAPVASNLNLSPGQTRPNLAIVPLDDDGKLTLRNNAGAIDLIADIQGWYDADDSGFRFVPKSPARILDSRFGNGRSGPLGANQSFALQITGRGNVPTSGVAGAVMNLTSTGVTLGGFVTVYPDLTTRPLASNLNLEIGKDVPNLVMTRLPSNGRARLYNAVGQVHLIGDVAGWFVD